RLPAQVGRRPRPGDRDGHARPDRRVLRAPRPVPRGRPARGRDRAPEPGGDPRRPARARRPGRARRRRGGGPMRRVALRGVRAQLGRFVLSVLAVLLGVAFVAGTFSLRTMLSGTFADIVETSTVGDAYLRGAEVTSSALDGGD